MEYISQVPIKQPDPPPPTASCYICLEHSTIDQPLLRNCACRGDAGWAHVACLAKFAASKVMETQREEDPSLSYTEIWEGCILCKTPHMQYMGVAMAKAFVKQYEHLPDTNALRFSSLFSMALSRFGVGNHDGAVELFLRLLKMCDFLTSEGIDAYIQEENVLSMLGALFQIQQKFNDALLIFKRQRELLVSIYGPNHPEIQDNTEMIVKVKERLGIGERGHTDPAAELVAARQEFKESRECDDIGHRLTIHFRLVVALRNDGKFYEGMKQFEELLTESRQSLGPDHPKTLRYENAASEYRQKILQLETALASTSLAAGARDVWAVIDCEQQPAISGQRVQVLRATKDAQKYICLIKNHNGVSSKFKVTQNQFILETGTTVVVHGVVSSVDLNGSTGIIRSFDKEKRRYAVRVGNKKSTVSIKPINLNVVFNGL